MPNLYTRHSAAKAYSYLRFSTPEQERGDSFKRQSEAALKYASQNGLELDDTLTLQDLGVSAFRGRNVQEGQLGAFIDAVDTGHVKPGSCLLVESLDRLSRDRLTQALTLFQSILERDITIVTLSDSKVYTRGSLDNLADLMFSLLIMSRAHEESAMKSLRMKSAWKAKRERAVSDGKAITSMLPLWLELNKASGEIEVIEKNVEIIRRIFTMYLNGHGKAKIAELFNDEAVPPFSKRADGWHHSYVGRILANPAVIGQFQPKREVEPSKDSTSKARRSAPDGDPIEDYFPPVVDREIYFAAQKQRRGRELRSGPRGAGFPNLFRGIAKCGVCGGTMNFMTKGKRYDTSPRADIYFQCANAKRKASTCGHKALWPYHAVEYFVTEGISDIDFAALFPAVIDSGREVVDKLMTAQDAASGEFGEVAEKLKNVAGLLVARPDNPALLDQLDILTERETALLETGERLASELVNARHQLATMRQSFETQDELLEQWRSEGHDEALRAKLNRSLTSNFDRFEFHPSEDSRSSSYIRHFFKSGERSWTLAMERAEGGRRGRYVGSATPFSRDGDDWSMELGGAGQMWFPPESELDHE